MAIITSKSIWFLQMKFWESCIFFLKIIKVFLDIPFGFINKFSSCFTISCCTFFTFVQKQSKVVVYVLIRAVLFFKNLKNIIKQCVSYSNFTTFEISVKYLSLTTEFKCFFHCLHIFLPLCLMPLKKLTNQCAVNIWEIRSKSTEKEMWYSHFLN